MKDKLSALLDGDLDEQSAHPVFESMRRDRSLRTDWEAYCLIGDVLRGDRHGNAGFVGRVMANIDEEPTMLAPPPSRVAAEGRRLWRSLMPLAASLMGVAAVGWVAHTLYSDRGPGAGTPVAVARSSAAVSAHTAMRPVAVAPAPVAVDPTREYVFVHQAMSGGGPISGVIQHVRTVSDVGQDSGR